MTSITTCSLHIIKPLRKKQREIFEKILRVIKNIKKRFGVKHCEKKTIRCKNIYTSRIFFKRTNGCESLDVSLRGHILPSLCPRWAMALRLYYPTMFPDEEHKKVLQHPGIIRLLTSAFLMFYVKKHENLSTDLKHNNMTKTIFLTPNW